MEPAKVLEFGAGVASTVVGVGVSFKAGGLRPS